MRLLDTQYRIKRSYAYTMVTTHPWIDVFALDAFPADKKESYLKKFKQRLFMYKVARCKNFLIEENSFFGKMNKLVYTLHQKFKCFFFLNEEKCVRSTLKALARYQGMKSEEFFSYAAVYLPTPAKCFFKREWFEEKAELEFEGKLFYVPGNYHEVLTTLYKDYMQLPPESERTQTHSVMLEQ